MSEGNGTSGNGVTHVQEPIENVASARKMSKVDMKRMQAYQERRRRLINKGVDPKKVDAVIAAEDYKNMPLEDKFERLQAIVLGALRESQKDILALRHNDEVISDAFDINLKSLAKCLERAGVTKELQGTIIQEVEKEVREEQKLMIETKAKANADAEKARMQAALADDAKLTQSEEPEGETHPEEATVFGG